jgi:hypothetical protein
MNSYSHDDVHRALYLTIDISDLKLQTEEDADHLREHEDQPCARELRNAIAEHKAQIAQLSFERREIEKRLSREGIEDFVRHLEQESLEKFNEAAQLHVYAIEKREELARTDAAKQQNETMSCVACDNRVN